MVHPSFFPRPLPQGREHQPVRRRPGDRAFGAGPPGRRRVYRAGRYCALTAGAFLTAATHWPPLSSRVVLAARTAPPAAIATATAAIETSSGASTITETCYSPYESRPASRRA